MSAQGAVKHYISEDVLLGTTYATIAVASFFVVARIVAKALKPKVITADDVLVLLSFLVFLGMAVSYLLVTPVIYRVSNAISGVTPPYADLMMDIMFQIKIFFATTIMFWVALWLVKFSLLALYRRLIDRNSVYIRVWWFVVIFCALSLIACITSNFTSCSSMSAWFTVGACATPRDIRAQIISLYFSFAVDVLTDLMIMILPLSIIRKVRLPKMQKLGISLLFCVGNVAIMAAILRIVSIGVKAGTTTPSSSWLAFWAVIEAAIAVVIGTCPGLYVSARAVHNSMKSSKYGANSNTYNSDGQYERNNQNQYTGPKGLYQNPRPTPIFSAHPAVRIASFDSERPMNDLRMSTISSDKSPQSDRMQHGRPKVMANRIGMAVTTYDESADTLPLRPRTAERQNGERAAYPYSSRWV